MRPFRIGEATEAIGGRSHHFVAHFGTFHVLAHGGDDARALQAEGLSEEAAFDGFVGEESHGDHDVAEVQG